MRRVHVERRRTVFPTSRNVDGQRLDPMHSRSSAPGARTSRIRLDDDAPPLKLFLVEPVRRVHGVTFCTPDGAADGAHSYCRSWPRPARTLRRSQITKVVQKLGAATHVTFSDPLPRGRSTAASQNPRDRRGFGRRARRSSARAIIPARVFKPIARDGSPLARIVGGRDVHALAGPRRPPRCLS